MLEAKSIRPSTASAPYERVRVVGPGFSGVPTVTAVAASGHRTVGLDIDAGKVANINAGVPQTGSQ